MNLTPSVTIVPYLHGRLAFSRHVREQCLAKRFDCIAVDLPEPFEEPLAEAVDDLPVIGAVVARGAGEPLYYVPTDPCDATIEAVRQALYASKICSYAQGFFQLQAASEEQGWDLKYGELALLWRGGCIIRAAFLERIKEAFDREPGLENLLLDPYFKNAVDSCQAGWRRVVATSARIGVPIPAIGSALNYYDGYRSERLPHNLLQAQRDYFGAHTYERIDREGAFHSEWLQMRREPEE